MTTALVMMTDPGNPEANGRMVHLLKTATALRDAGEDTAVYLHGAGVNWATAFAEREDRFTQHYGELFDEVTPLIAGSASRWWGRTAVITQPPTSSSPAIAW